MYETLYVYLNIWVSIFSRSQFHVGISKRHFRFWPKFTPSPSVFTYLFIHLVLFFFSEPIKTSTLTEMPLQICLNLFGSFVSVYQNEKTKYKRKSVANSEYFPLFFVSNVDSPTKVEMMLMNACSEQQPKPKHRSEKGISKRLSKEK